MAAQTLRYHQYLGLLIRSRPFVEITKNAPVYLALLCCRKLAFGIDFADLLPIDSPLPLDRQIKYFHLEPASESIWKEFWLCGYGIEKADDL